MLQDLGTKKYYKIGEVANYLNINASTIRFWEKEFSQLQPKKNKKGDRFFNEDDIKLLKLIYSLVKEKGFTIEGAKTSLQEQKDHLLEKQEIIERLEKVKLELIAIKNQM